MTIVSTSSPTLDKPTIPDNLPSEIIEKGFTMDESLLSGNENDRQTIVPAEQAPVKEDKAADPKVEGETKKEIAKQDDGDITLEYGKKTEKKADDAKVEAKTEKKSVLKAPVEATKVDDKTKAATETKTSTTIKPIVPKAAGEDAFDYTGYSQQEQINLKNMSRQSREFTANLIKEHRELSKLKDSTYLQHERGYTLSPEYQSLQQQGQLGYAESQVWQQQLELCAAGKPFRDIVGWNQDGSPKMGTVEIQPSHAEEERLRMNVYKCSQVVDQIRGQLTTFPQQYKQRITADLQTIKDIQKQLFGWHQDPKLMEHTVNVEGVGDKKLSDIKKEFIAQWPIYLQNNPAVDVAADLMIALRIRDEELRQATSSQQIAQIKQEEVARGEPKIASSGSSASGTKAVNGIDEFSMSSFPASMLE